MIEITRSLARTLSTVLRKCFRKTQGGTSPVLTLTSDGDGMRIRCFNHEVAVEHFQVGNLPTRTMSLPLDALTACQGRDDGRVTLESASDNQVVARWHDAGMPQAMTFTVSENKNGPTFPVGPELLTDCPVRFLTAFDIAAATTAASATRYALERVQLRGKAGQVVGTDSKQLYVEGGFKLGFDDNVLVPRVSVFGCPELQTEESIQIGKTETHVVIGVGPWKFFLAIDQAGRFPDFEAIIPKPRASDAICRFDPADADFLTRSLPRLPGREIDSRPLTLDLNGKVSVRARGEASAQVTELVLSRTAYSGAAVRVNLHRDNLARALELKLTDLHIHDPDRPLVCRDDRRMYVMMPLNRRSAIPETDGALRLVSSDTVPRPMKVAPPGPEKSTMTTPLTNGNVTPAAASRQRVSTPPEGKNRIGMVALMAEAQAVKESARSTFNLASRLLAGLKRHRQQSKLVANTLASLKQLQTIDG